jgi:glycosyltransferase involved in cell wall biosynthesis
MRSSPVAIIILTYNEEANLRSCLESIKDFFDEIFLVDSFSTDKTLEIAREYTDKIYQNPFVDWVQQRNWALENLPFSYDWALFLDADERLTRELCVEISNTVKATDQSFDGYYIRRNFYFLGRWLKHGGYQKDYVLRLIKKDKAHFVATGGFREKIVLTGKMGTLTNPMLHEDHNQLTIWIQKQDKRATMDAKEMVARQAVISKTELFDKKHLEHYYRIWLQEKIWPRLPLFIRPFIRFLYNYILRLGFLDGKEGFVYWFLMALWYPLLVDAKYLELIKAKEPSTI